MKRTHLSFLLSSLLIFGAACTNEVPKEQPKQQTTVQAETPSGAEAAAAKAPAQIKDPEKDSEAAPAALSATVKELRELVRAKSLKPGFRVPEGHFYRMDVTLDPDFMTYRGHSDMWVVNNSAKAWNEVHFHLYPNNEAISGSLKGLKIDKAVVAGETVEGKDMVSHYVLPLKNALEPGGSVEIRLEFRGMLKRGKMAESEGMAGLIEMLMDSMGGTGDYGVFAYSSGIASLSLWYPVIAAYDASGWDTQSGEQMGDFSYFDVADYHVTIHVPSDFALATSGTEVQRDQETRVFVAGGVREFTVLAGKGLKPQEDKTPSGVVIRSWTLEKESKEGAQQLKVAKDSVAFFEEKFGPYPYTELDVVGADLRGGAGGVEFPGLITVARMLYMSSYASSIPGGQEIPESPMLKDTLMFVVAHEVAHQWWNAVVGSHSRKHPFVDEAMANWSALEFVGKVHGTAAREEQLFLQFELPYHLSRFMGGKDMPVDSPTSAFDNTINYSAIVYAKGGLFVDAVRKKLGDDTMYKAISNYYEEYSFKIAQPEDLLRHFSAASKMESEVTYLADRWLKGAFADRDIGTLNPARAIPFLVKNLNLDLPPWATQLMKEEGTWEAVKIVSNVVQGEDWDKDVNFNKITEMGTRIVKQFAGDLLKEGVIDGILNF